MGLSIELMFRRPVVPVLTVRNVREAVATVEALATGGLDVIEITLRTPAALDSIRAVAQALPDVLVGAGTVLTAEDCERAVAAQAAFLVSPGCTDRAMRAARDCGVPWLPASATISEALALLEAGFSYQKLFPARSVGGIDYLKAALGPIPQVGFCPTGGIDADNAADYLACPNVVAVGGSWVAPSAAVERGAWNEITALAQSMSKLGRAWRP